MDSCYVLIAATMDLLLSNNHTWVRLFLGYNVANWTERKDSKAFKSFAFEWWEECINSQYGGALVSLIYFIYSIVFYNRLVKVSISATGMPLENYQDYCLKHRTSVFAVGKSWTEKSDYHLLEHARKKVWTPVKGRLFDYLITKFLFHFCNFNILWIKIAD